MGQRRWHSRDYLRHLLSRDEGIDGAAPLLADKITAKQTPSRDHIFVGWSSTAYLEAGRVVNDIHMHCNSPLTLGQLQFRQHQLTALEMAQDWPNKRFDEIHWLRALPSAPIPYLQLFAHAKIVHIHHLEPPGPDVHPHARHYLWANWDELAAFWASLYLARENSCIPGLNWDSYTAWSPSPRVGQVESSWGTTTALATSSLLAQLKPADHSDTTQALLLIESNLDFTFGDLINTAHRLEAAIEQQIIASGWLARGVSGCGLRLLRFGPP